MREVDRDELERLVLEEIESYEYEVRPGALGRPFPEAKVEALLSELRACLVEPEWQVVDLNDTFEQGRRAPLDPRPCVLVADDGDVYRLYFDPVEQEFALAAGDPPTTIGVRGDLVGCWMAR